MLSDAIRKRGITKEQIQAVNAGLTSIGSSSKFKDIVRLHISHNQIRSLIGIEQFTSLKYFSVAFNQIDDIKEFDRIQTQLVYLVVNGNPFTQDLNHVEKLLLRFPLEKLDNEPIDAIQVSTIKLISSYKNYIPLAEKILYSKDSCKSKLTALNKYCSDQEQGSLSDFLQHCFAYQKKQFKTQSLKVHLTMMAMHEDIDLRRFAEDDQYHDQILLEMFARQTEFPYSKEFNLALLDYIFHLQLEAQKTRRQETKIRPMLNSQLKLKSYEETTARNKQVHFQEQQTDRQFVTDREVATNTQLINDRQIATERQYINNLSQTYETNTEQDSNDIQESIKHFKGLYIFNKGYLLLAKTLKQSSGRFIYRTLRLIKAEKQKLKDSAILRLQRVSFVRNMRLQRESLSTLNCVSKTYNLVNTLRPIILRQKGQDIQYLVDKVKNMMIKAGCHRRRTLLKKAFTSLIPRFRVQSNKLKFTFLQHKIQGILRISFFSMRSYLNIPKKRKITKRSQSTSSFMDSIALRMFRAF